MPRNRGMTAGATFLEEEAKEIRQRVLSELRAAHVQRPNMSSLVMGLAFAIAFVGICAMRADVGTTVVLTIVAVAVVGAILHRIAEMMRDYRIGLYKNCSGAMLGRLETINQRALWNLDDDLPMAVEVMIMKIRACQGNLSSMGEVPGIPALPLLYRMYLNSYLVLALHVEAERRASTLRSLRWTPNVRWAGYPEDQWRERQEVVIYLNYLLMGASMGLTIASLTRSGDPAMGWVALWGLGLSGLAFVIMTINVLGIVLGFRIGRTSMPLGRMGRTTVAFFQVFYLLAFGLAIWASL